MELNVRPQFAAIVVMAALANPGATLGQALKVTPKKISPDVGTGTLSVSAAPSTVNFNLIPGKSATGNSPVSITTTWSGSTLGSTMSLYSYFASPTAALSAASGSAVIPSSAVSGQMTTGLPSSFTPFTQTNPVGSAAGGLKLFTQVVSGSGAGSRTDALSLTIDLTALPELPAGTYTGTLIIQAQVL
jgi:hypothetical protein